MFIVSLKVEKGDYEKGVDWIKDLISGCIFDNERSVAYLQHFLTRMLMITRLSVIVAKQLQELPYEKRNGNSVSRAWVTRLAFDIEKSTSEACSLLSLLDFIPATAKALSDEPESVTRSLEEVRQCCE